jgi:hypothetical protein
MQTSLAVCEEFTNTILVDSKRNSIIVNVDSEWFPYLDSRLSEIGFKLIHKSSLRTGYTCAYIPRI